MALEDFLFDLFVPGEDFRRAVEVEQGDEHQVGVVGVHVVVARVGQVVACGLRERDFFFQPGVAVAVFQVDVAEDAAGVEGELEQAFE